jgi:hypothetical protein
VHDPDGGDWGFFRRPVLFGPAVGFLAFLASEAISSPASGSADGLIWMPLFLIVATIFAAIPYLLGAYLLREACRALPIWLVRFMAFRLVLGGLIGGMIAWPFTYALNGMIPSATADPRFNFTSMLVGGVVAGGYCAAFFSASRSGAPSDNSLERARGE